ncbi:MAG: hypothetical protein SFV54_28885 [Bryobacteraceae bacterium]|nr:hypothetical protein [Bryobacteraceae bacterium]
MRFSAVLWGVLLMAETAGTPRQVGEIRDPRIDESSGLAASRRHPGCFWTVNDGGPPVVYLLKGDGAVEGRARLDGVKYYDPEALALGPGPDREDDYLYVGDIGDNDRKRPTIRVYRLAEPDIERRYPAETLVFRYPDGPHDAEAMLVHPQTGALYIITKAKGSDARTLVFRSAAPQRTEGVRTLEPVGEIQFAEESALSLLVGRVTDAAISPDGRRVALCGYVRGWMLELPDGAAFDEIWKQRPIPFELGQRAQGEAIAFRGDGRALIATSEGTPSPIFEIPVYLSK